MSKAVKRSGKPSAASSFSAGMFTVEGRLFSSRAHALAYCKAERIPIYKIGICPPPKVEIDPVKLSLREDWSLRVLFVAADPVLIFEHASEAQAFKVRMSSLVELVSTVKARIRELAREGDLL